MRALLSNTAIWLPLSVAFGVQLYKALADWIQTGHFSPKVLAQAGGMPSSHSAMVCSLATVVGYEYGLDSAVFAIALVLATVVMYDARGCARRAANKRVSSTNCSRLSSAAIPSPTRNSKSWSATLPSRSSSAA